MSTEEDYTESEVLTGAELYLYLLRQNEEQQERAQSKLREYTALKDTLQVLTERSRRRVLAPVAGGLAYFPAELNATNTILVLLGDSWFAERSAVQASEIAGRRIDFLRREAEVLQQEETSLRSKQDLFLSEMPEAQGAVAQLLAEKDARRAALVQEAAAPPSSSAAAPVPPASTAASSSALVAETSSQQQRQGTVRTTAAAPLPTSTDERNETSSHAVSAAAVAATTSSPAPTASMSADFDFSAVDAALTTFDEQDELTEDELIALEKELGDRLDDDAYVEQVMTERMIAKKERRVRAELERRQAELERRQAVLAPPQQAEITTDAVTATAPAEQKEACAAAPVVPSTTTAAAAAATTKTATFRTPGEIGGGVGSAGNAGGADGDSTAAKVAANTIAMKHEDPVASSLPTRPSPLYEGPPPIAAATAYCAAKDAGSAAASPTLSTCSSSSHKERHVHFHSEVDVRAEHTAAPVDVAAATTDAAASPSLLRSTYRVGDIVEHSDTQLHTTALPPSPPLPMQRQKPKRRSLFMRDLEGDGS